MERFSDDLADCLKVFKEFVKIIEKSFDIESEVLYKHHVAKKGLPKIVAPPMGHFSVVQASQMVGKTVLAVKSGFREEIEGVHSSEVIIIHFTDGSTMGIDSGSNALNILDSDSSIAPEDFSVDFIIHWVPSPSKIG